MSKKWMDEDGFPWHIVWALGFLVGPIIIMVPNPHTWWTLGWFLVGLVTVIAVIRALWRGWRG